MTETFTVDEHKQANGSRAQRLVGTLVHNDRTYCWRLWPERGLLAIHMRVEPRDGSPFWRQCRRGKSEVMKMVVLRDLLRDYPEVVDTYLKKVA